MQGEGGQAWGSKCTMFAMSAEAVLEGTAAHRPHRYAPVPFVRNGHVEACAKGTVAVWRPRTGGVMAPDVSDRLAASKATEQKEAASLARPKPLAFCAAMTPIGAELKSSPARRRPNLCPRPPRA